MATIDDVRPLGTSLERSYEVLVGIDRRDAWRMDVPKKLSRADDALHPLGPNDS